MVFLFYSFSRNLSAFMISFLCLVASSFVMRTKLLSLIVEHFCLSLPFFKKRHTTCPRLLPSDEIHLSRDTAKNTATTISSSIHALYVLGFFHLMRVSFIVMAIGMAHPSFKEKRN